ncbi:FKBP-type peptidyl-prolyl cis-trans isomerase [Maribacter sp. 2304DJ31-5]|uniref:FKBP-type peptidyl-prolyl cis-trans isomerase n=1 Tax=Maribacter sp. 2304DJ31-5 TaxID=3386273 RepID=UPI0039BC7B57
MKLKSVYIIIALMLGFLSSCKKNDDSGGGGGAPPRLLSEVAAEDDEEIVTFLKTHFYNYEEFETPPTGFDYKIRLDTIAGDNADKISIFDRSELITERIMVASSEFRINDEEEFEHNLYILVARQGAVPDSVPTIGDNAILRYEGSLLNGTLFDASTNQPVRFNLSGVVRGFGNGVEYFQKGTGPIENTDGTITYEGFGIGAIFIPSGLGYFNSPPAGTGISAYSPLVFKIDAFDYEPDTDLDGDGIPSILEDLDGDGNLNNDNTDGDFDPRGILYNYRDADDDNDGIPTREEIVLDDEGNFVRFKDTDGDGIDDHLDND